MGSFFIGRNKMTQMLATMVCIVRFSLWGGIIS